MTSRLKEMKCKSKIYKVQTCLDTVKAYFWKKMKKVFFHYSVNYSRCSKLQLSWILDKSHQFEIENSRDNLCVFCTIIRQLFIDIERENI